MADLAAIIRATRASASALRRMQTASLLCKHTHGADYKASRKAYDRAKRDYERAQTILANNPLPSDR